jgi:hypothetical protein
MLAHPLMGVKTEQEEETGKSPGASRMDSPGFYCIAVYGIPEDSGRRIRFFLTNHFLLDLLDLVPNLLSFSLQGSHVLADPRSGRFVPLDIEFLKVLLKGLNQVKKFLVTVHWMSPFL